MQDVPFPNTKKMTREERWEARRRAKMGIQGGDPSFLKPAEPSASAAVVNQPGAPSIPSGEIQPPLVQSSVPNVPNNLNIPGVAGVPVPQSSFASPPANSIPQSANVSQPDSYINPNVNPNPNANANLNLRASADFPREENPPEFYLPEPVLVPPENQQQGFFANPVSEAEQKRAQMMEEYKKHAQQDMNRQKKPDGYLPENREAPASRGNIRMINPEQQQIDNKKKQYQVELSRQIQERQQVRRGKPKTPPQEFFPFGRPGAGAPRRDAFGNIIAMRPPKLNENDPNFMRPSEYYQELADPYQPQPKIGNASFPQPQGYNSFNYQNPSSQQPQNYSQAYPPANIPPPQQAYQPPPSQYQQPPNAYQPPLQQAYQPPLQQSYQFQPPPSQYQQPPNAYQAHPPSVYQSNQDLIPPAHQLLENHNLPEIPRQSPRGYVEPNANLRESQDPQEDASRLQKMELARALQEQIDERRRKREEEKRQKILEERLEEERIERQRREMEEEARRETEKKKKQIQDMQNFNVQVAQEPKKPAKRVRTPIDMPEPRRPPIQPPSFQPPSFEAQGFQASSFEHQAFQPPGEVPKSPEIGRQRPPETTVVRNLQSQVDSEMAKLKQEFSQQQIEMRQAILKLQEETRDANFQRQGAEMELEKLRDELKQREVQDELRQKELFQVINHPMPPPPVVKPRQPPAKTFDSYGSIDIASKSLTGESKFIPLAKPDPIFPPEPQPKKELDNLFPSLPDSVRTANSSIGIDRLNQRNDDRLRALEGIDATDEISKLDNLLKYLDGNAPNSRELASIHEVDEDFNYSLPNDRSYA